LFVVFVFSAFFSYFYVVILNVLPQAISESSQISTFQALFTFIISISLVCTSFRIHKIKPLKIVISSLVMTILATSIIPLVPWYEARITLIFFAGILFSVGQLGVLTHFWKNSQSQKRGLLGGVVGLFAVIVYFVARVVVDQTNLLVDSVIIALVPIILALFVAVTYAKIGAQSNSADQRNYYPEKRTVILYSIPWILFCLINSTLAKNLLSSQIFASYFMLAIAIQAIASFMGVFIGGVIADFFGRRLSLTLSISLYGLSMALSGFIPDTAIIFIAFSLEGLSWGILLTLYSFVVWGDLANKENCAKLYAIGLAVYYVTVGIGLLPTIFLRVSSTDSALIGCSIIFMSNLSIALAPELLPLEARKIRKLKGYLRKVKKIADNQT
jgi:hypothetical protein